MVLILKAYPYQIKLRLGVRVGYGVVAVVVVAAGC